jgi:hypothetical protein
MKKLAGSGCRPVEVGARKSMHSIPLGRSY